MMNRRALLAMIALAPAVASCSFCYPVEKLTGVYRAEDSSIGETMTLNADGTYLHEWRSADGYEANWGRWQGECSILFEGYTHPSGYRPQPYESFFAGPPTYWFFGRPTFFLHEPRLTFVWWRPVRSSRG